MILLELARSLSTGTLPFDCGYMEVGEPVKVLFIEQEIGEYGLKDRAEKIFEKEDKAIYGNNLWYVSKVPELQLDTKEGQDILFDLINEIRPNILILDPIGRLHGYDENRNDEIQRLFVSLETLIKIFKEQEMSIILSHHFGKSPNDPEKARDPLDAYNFRGASKYKDNPDSLITVKKLHHLKTDHKAWQIQMRFETRQDAGLPDMLLNVNEDDDLRVKYKKMFSDKPQPIKKTDVDSPEAISVKQSALRFAE